MKDILKISYLYLKKYIAWLTIIVIIFSLFTFSHSNEVLRSLKYDSVGFKFNQKYDYNFYEVNYNAIENPKSFWLEHSGRFEKFYENYNEKLTPKDIEKIQENMAVGILVNEFHPSSLYYNNIYGDIGERQWRTLYKDRRLRDITLKILEVIPEEKHSRISELIGDLGLVDMEYNQLLYKEQVDEETQQKMIELKEKLGVLSKELHKIAPLYIASNSTNGMMYNLVSYNLESDFSDLSVKELLYSKVHAILFALLSVSIVLVVFGLEYHTNFGKFVASMPYKKTTIYFAKVLTALIALAVVYIVLGFVNIWAFKNSIISDLVTVPTAFFAYGKVYLFGLFMVLLGAIFAAFCGSIISILAMYVPSLSLVLYPIFIYGLTASNFNYKNLGHHEVLTVDMQRRYEAVVNGDNPLFMPIRFFMDGYFETKYFMIYLSVLLIILLLSSLIYKKHNIDEEGQFFTFKSASIICYILSLVTFATTATAILVTFGINVYLAYVVSYIVISPILYALYKVKIRV